jgi:excisionase family DNA binding protein
VPTKTRPRVRGQDLTPEQIADRLQVSRDRVVGWIKKDWLDATPLPRGWRVSQEALDRFIRDRPWEA